jgi:hypothetical protein
MKRTVHTEQCPDKGNLTLVSDDVEKVFFFFVCAEITHPRLGHSGSSSAAFIRKKQKKKSFVLSYHKQFYRISLKNNTCVSVHAYVDRRHRRRK